MSKNLLFASLLVVAPAVAFAQNTAPELTTEAQAVPRPQASISTETHGQPTQSGPEIAASQYTEDILASPDQAVPEEQTPQPQPETAVMVQSLQNASASATEFLRNGGPSIWAIAALSVITLTLILWKIWRLALIGAWSRGKAGMAVDLFETGDTERAMATVEGRRGVRSIVVANSIRAIRNLPEDRAREETARVAKRELAQAGVGLRALELIATIAPLLGLLGTVLGMIAAFQALQQSGNRADPALLAGGIWEALLTTAAGMAVAIPASAALTWFEAVIDRIRRDVEDGATRLFVSDKPQNIKLVAE